MANYSIYTAVGLHNDYRLEELVLDKQKRRDFIKGTSAALGSFFYFAIARMGEFSEWENLHRSYRDWWQRQRGYQIDCEPSQGADSGTVRC